MPTLDQILCLKTIAEVGSLGQASERLHRAKSAVSYAIANLEKEVDFKILDRSQYRLTLTKKGEMFLAKAILLLEQSEELKRSVSQIASNVELKLAFSATALYPLPLVSSALKKTMKAFPQTEIIFHREILSGELMLKNKETDLSIIENVQAGLDFETKKILTVKMPLILASEHPFWKLPKEQQTFQSLFKYPQIILRSTSESSDKSVGVFKETLKWSVSDLSSKIELIKSGLGWGRLPDHLVNGPIRNKALKEVKHLAGHHSQVELFLCRRHYEFHGNVSRFLWEQFPSLA